MKQGTIKCECEDTMIICMRGKSIRDILSIILKFGIDV